MVLGTVLFWAILVGLGYMFGKNVGYKNGYEDGHIEMAQRVAQRDINKNV